MIPRDYEFIKFLFYFAFFDVILILLIGPLSDQELQKIAENFDFDESDVECDLLEDNDEQELLDQVLFSSLPAENNDDEMFSSEDEAPLINFVKTKSDKKWLSDINFQPTLCHNQTNVDNSFTLLNPIEYFEKYLDFNFFDNMAMYTNMREVEIFGKSLDTNANEIRKFFGCSMLMGIYNLPRLKMFWGRETRVPIISDSISRNRYFELRTKLKIVDDNSVSNEARKIDKFWKIRPMVDKIQAACHAHERPPFVCIDEQIIPFHGQVKMRQYIKGKPNPVGLKVFVMASLNGLPLDILLYEGKGTQIESALYPTPEKLDIGGRCVLKLVDTLTTNTSIFTDRYFTSIS